MQATVLMHERMPLWAAPGVAPDNDGEQHEHQAANHAHFSSDINAGATV